MPLGIQQNNDFTQFTMDVWNDKIFYQEKEFPAGFIAMTILNIPKEKLPELIQAGGAPTFLFPVVVQGSDEEAAAVFPQLRERILYLTELLWKYPPFCYNDYEKEMRRINILFDERNLLQIRTPNSELQTEFLRFCVGIIRIPTIIGGGGLARLTGITFFALALGFLLAKDKKNYGKITLKGLQNPMLGTIIMAYIMAGMLAQLLRQSGLIDALIWGITRLGLNAGWIPMIAFLTCVLISTSCGTSTGSVAAVAPVLLPLAHGLGINMGLMCGAIISGAIFGDNLAPISDTTISSALTQEADISQVVRTRFPYAAISGAVAAVLFAVVGLTQDANIPADLELDGSTAKSLFLLVLPVLMVILMRKGWDLMSTLILCNLSGIVLNLVLGTIAPAKMFANDGPIVAGMSGMMTLVLYVTLLFQLLEILNSSGAFDGLTVSLMKHCKSPRSGELICYLVAALGSVVTGGSGIAIVFFGSLVRRITKAFHIDRCRGANILDGVACGATGLMPHGNPTLVSLGVALAIDGVDPNFSFLDIIPYNFHCWGLMLIFLLSILTGIGRRFEKPEETANA